jgi:ectoine hydroxylase-related dioxygenase (phytanoyl-CoA dioxygenase family)
MDIDLLTTQFESFGFCHLPSVLPAELVGRLRLAFDRAAADYHNTWKKEIAEGRVSASYCDIPNILDRDDAFVDVVDTPELVPVLLSLVGPDVQLNHTHARLFPPGKTMTAPWHSDLAETLGIALEHCPNFFLKIHYFFEDLRPDQGCLAFIPGSHRFPRTYPRPKIANPEISPLVTKVVPKAGDVVIFNTHLLHMATDNDSPLVRKSLIYAYSHFWVKHYANSVPKDLDRLANTRLRRQLFGVEEEGVSYFDQRCTENVSGPMTTMRVAAKTLIKRIFRTGSHTQKR